MNLHRFDLTREFIELDSLLKLLSIASSGGVAKMMIAEGMVAVDGEVEHRKTRKLRGGERITVGDEEIVIVAPRISS